MLLCCFQAQTPMHMPYFLYTNTHCYPAQPYILKINFLLLQILAAIRKQLPTVRSNPANICAYWYSPCFAWISAPAIGGPVNTAKLTIVNIIPILVPIIRKSVVRLLRVAGKRLCIAAPTMP